MAAKKFKSKPSKGLTIHFKELKTGDKVAIVYHPSFPAFLPKRVEGQTGIILGKRGDSYLIEIRQGTQKKQFIVESAHLKKIKTSGEK